MRDLTRYYKWADKFVNKSSVEDLFDSRKLRLDYYLAITKELIGGEEYEEYDNENNLVDYGVTPLQIGALYVEIGRFDKDENGKEIRDSEHFTPIESCSVGFKLDYETLKNEIDYLLNVVFHG